MLQDTVILVAARLKSQRLKEKALLNLYDKPLIVKLVDRLKKSKLSKNIVICTSSSSLDDRLNEVAKINNIEIFRGDADDVMSRFIKVGEERKINNLVRVTGDNPLTDPVQMDNMIISHLENNSEFTFTEDLPHGTRSEIINLNALIKCHQLIQDKSATEYMTWMLNRPDFFRVNRYKVKTKKLKRSDISLTVDTEQDYKLIKNIYTNFNGLPPKLEKIIEYYDTLPQSMKRKVVDKHLKNNLNNINVKFKTDV
tara:strand:+ start:41 stop:802 length:762 start_codon:yes stop_codon:yes gene_type:complete